MEKEMPLTFQILLKKPLDYPESNNSNGTAYLKTTIANLFRLRYPGQSIFQVCKSGNMLLEKLKRQCPGCFIRVWNNLMRSNSGIRARQENI